MKDAYTSCICFRHSPRILYILAEGPPKSLRYPLKSGSCHDGFYFFQDTFLAAADDELSLMCGDGAECTTAKASPMDIDGELNHVICRYALSFVFGVRKACIGQVERTVNFFLTHRGVWRIDYYDFVSLPPV